MIYGNKAFSDSDSDSKLADRWQPDVYVVRDQPDKSIPVFELSREDGTGRTLVLHRNLLLPISAIGDMATEKSPPQKKVTPSPRDVVKEQRKDSSSSSGSNSEDESSVIEAIPVTVPTVRKPVPTPRRSHPPTTVPEQEHSQAHTTDALIIMEMIHEDELSQEQVHMETEEEFIDSIDGLEGSPEVPALSPDVSARSTSESSISSSILDHVAEDQPISGGDTESPVPPRRSQRARKPNSRYDPIVFMLFISEWIAVLNNPRNFSTRKLFYVNVYMRYFNISIHLY